MNDFVSLADGWRTFVETKFPRLLKAETFRPPSPGGQFEVTRDRKTGDIGRPPKIGPEHDSHIDKHAKAMAEGAFRDLIALKCQAFEREGAASDLTPIDFEGWFWECSPLLWQTRI